MDKAEALAEQYLKSLGLSEIVYEPSGESTPPDFSVNGTLAVEVTRLVQRYKASSTLRSLSATGIPYVKSFEQLLEGFGAPNKGRSWIVSLHFKRPLNWTKMKKPVKAWLEAFLDGPQDAGARNVFSDGNWITLYPTSTPLKKALSLQIVSDNDGGGLIVQEVFEGLEASITEKTLAIDAIKDDYDEWWLVLPDLIGLGLDTFDHAQLRPLLTRRPPWNRVIILDVGTARPILTF